ncbi:MAG: alpha-amylase family glycosyl hydrolase [Myxococcaceae bacterium]
MHVSPVHRRAAALLALLGSFALGCSCRPVDPPPDAGTPDAGDGGEGCPVSFEFRPTATASSVSVLGEWDGFDHGLARPMEADGTGGYSASLSLPPGTYGYAFLVNGGEQLDPANGNVRYVDARAYSRLVVADCLAPSLRVAPPVQLTRASAGQGRFTATVLVTAPAIGAGDLRVEGSVRAPEDHVGSGYAPRALTAAELTLSADGTRATVTLTGLADGKYTVTLRAFAGSRASESLLLPFWVEAQTFSFRDSPMYMIVTDRFRNGETGNDPAKVSGVPLAADFQGGDLKGLELAITEGYFDALGVRSLWITPWQTQPAGSFVDAEGTHQTMGYHGYWPIKAREVDPRLGGADALHRVVEAAHRHGIRVVMDTVLNHVHQEHEYFKDPAKKGWFRTNCVCGTSNCDWDGKRLECLFASYMPDINWTVGDGAEQFLADTLWWVEQFDLDGLRVDAVKHVEDAAITSLTGRMRERFEQAGTKYYMFGETFSADYGLINHSIGPTALDAQLDFPLFMQVPEPVFARDDQGFQHAKYWTEQSVTNFAAAPMVTFVGNHDVARFITKADPANRDRQGSKWSNLPGTPVGQEPYDRLWLAMLNLVTSPGVPLIFYGDEYGEYGGSDPDNRHFMNAEPFLWAEQRSQLARMKKLLQSRGKLRGLARGPMTTLWCNDLDNGKGNLWAYQRPDLDPRQSAVVVLNRTANTWTAVGVNFPPELGWSAGQKVYDLLSDREWTISGTGVSIDVPGRGGVILGLR